MTNILIIHHNDSDGYMSAAIAHEALKHDPKNRIKSYRYNYGDDYTTFCQAEAKESELVYILDVCLPKEFMLEHADKIIWIDHHVSSINRSVEEGWCDKLKHYVVSKVSDTDTRRESASDLCWEYFFPGTLMPEGVYLVGRHDVWDHSGNDSEALSVFLKYGRYRRQDISDSDNIYRKFIKLSRNDQEFAKYIAIGRSMLTTKRSIDYHDLRFAGYKSYLIDTSICVVHANIPGRNSSFFEGAPKFYRNAQIVIPYFYNPRSQLWQVSLFKAPWAEENSIKALDVLTMIMDSLEDDVDGGGHPDACGYTTPDIRRDFHNLLIPYRE